MTSPPEHPDDDRPIEEVLTELRRRGRSSITLEQRRRRMTAMLLAVFLVLTPTVVIGAHLLIDYESGRVAQTIERSLGPFTDEALRPVCRSIKIPLFGPEPKTRLHCSASSETETGPSTTTTSPTGRTRPRPLGRGALAFLVWSRPRASGEACWSSADTTGMRGWHRLDPRRWFSNEG